MTPDKTHITDMPKALELFDKARALMTAAGNAEQWPVHYPATHDVLDDIINDRAYVLRYHGQLAGIISIGPGPYSAYEDAPEALWLNDAPYASLHRVCINQELGLKGLGSKLLDLGEAVAMAYGMSNVKIHTHQNNIAMQKLLAKKDYQNCGLIPGRDGKPRPAYQKELHINDPGIQVYLSDALALAASPRGHVLQEMINKRSA